MVKIKTYVGGPKWAGLKDLLYELSTIYNLDLVIESHDKGWFRETIYFSLEGDAENVKAMGKHMERSLTEYNK